MHGLVRAAEYHGLLPVDVAMAWFRDGDRIRVESVIMECGLYRTLDAGEAA